MLSWRSISLVLILLSRLVAPSARGSDALDRYNSRLDEIARSYKQQFAEIRKSQHRIGSGKTDFRAGEQQIKELGLMRSVAIAEAKLIYQKEQKGEKQTEAVVLKRLSQEEQQREFMAARRKLFEDGQKAFWQRVALEEPKIAELMALRREAFEDQQTAFWAGLPLRETQTAELMAARRKAVGEEQTAFWAGLFEPPKTIPLDRQRIASIQVSTQRVEKQMTSQPQKSTTVQVQNALLLADAH